MSSLAKEREGQQAVVITVSLTEKATIKKGACLLWAADSRAGEGPPKWMLTLVNGEVGEAQSS
jgi:hypothetical protein